MQNSPIFRRPIPSMLALILFLLLSTISHAAEITPQASQDWRLAIKGRSYMLVGMDFFQMLDHMASLGVHYVDITPTQPLGGGLKGTVDYKMDAATRQAVKAKLKQTGVSMPIYWTGKLDGEEDCRQIFEFCKDMGVEIISAEPRPDQMDLWEKYCKQYHIALAIHNHPQPSHYWDAQTVLDAIAGRSPLLGACADSGHWLRSGLNPLDCLKKLEGHIVMLHYKDVAPDNAPAPAKKGKAKKARTTKPFRDVEWGTGDCQAVAMMAELKRQQFKGYFSMEYEHPASFLENLPKNIAFFNKCKQMTEQELQAWTAKK